MNIVLTPENINVNNFYYGKKLENNIMENSYFYNLFYSNEFCHINNILIKLNINDIISCEYFNKHKFKFNVESNREIIDFLVNFEKELLNIFYSNNEPDYKLTKQMEEGEIKINNYSNIKIKNNISKRNIFLKISGIWETDNKIGIIFKFIV